MYYIDPDGKNGDVSVKKGDKDSEDDEERKNKIIITQTYHVGKDAATEILKRTGKSYNKANFDEKIIEGIRIDIANKGFDGKKIRTVEIDGESWEVAININIKVHNKLDDAVKEFKNNPTHNLLYLNNSGDSHSSGRITNISIRQKKNYLLQHEGFHNLGLGHDNTYDNSDKKYSMMSYRFGRRALTKTDLKNFLSPILSLSKSGNIKVFVDYNKEKEITLEGPNGKTLNLNIIGNGKTY